VLSQLWPVHFRRDWPMISADRTVTFAVFTCVVAEGALGDPTKCADAFNCITGFDGWNIDSLQPLTGLHRG
jgi:hypothetical protein